jgi:hypothetical protein
LNRTVFYIGIVCGAAVKLLGFLLLVAAALKAWDLARSHVPRTEVWEIAYNVFIICQIGFEVFLGAWLISGLFKKLAVKVAILCFVVFFIVTMWKVGIGAKTCGCFGPVEVAPLVTLLAVDLPAIIILALFGLLPEVTASTPVALPAKEQSGDNQLEE